MTERPPVAVTFALPDEGRAFTRMLTDPSPARGALAPVTGRLGGRPVTVIFTGVGAGADCKRRLAMALAGFARPPQMLIASGFAGGLQPGLAVGDLVLGENCSDPALVAESLRLLAGGHVHSGALTTQLHLAETVAAKAALAKSAGAIAVEMETEWIAAACATAGVPMLALRVISDAADQPFPAPGHILFDVARQRPRYVRLPLWLLGHPGQIGAFASFVRGLTPARQRLAEALRTLISQTDEPPNSSA